MSISITLYKNFSKKKNSTKQPTGGTTVNVVFKDDCTIEAPIFIIKGVDLDVNYCLFNGAYYYIDDIVLRNNNIYELHCSKDVLATYKSTIGNYIAFVERAASSYDQMVTDNYLSSSQTVVKSESKYTDIGLGLGCYIFSVYNLNGIKWYATTNMGALVSMFNNISYDASYITAFPANIALGALDFADWMGDAMWVPFNVSQIADTNTTITQLTFGYIQANLASSFSCYPLSYDNISPAAVQLNLPTNYYSDFRKANDRFSSYTMLLPGVGTVPLPAIHTVDNKLYIKAAYDFFSGSVNYLLEQRGSGLDDYKIISQYNGQFAVKLPMARSGGIDGGNLITTAIGAGVAIASDGVASAAAAKAGEAILSSGVSAAMATISPNVSITGGAGNRAFNTNNNVVRVSLQNYGTKEYATTVAGRPLYENKKINTLSGFIKCGAASIDIPGEAPDKDAVNYYLNGGFYYE